MSKMHNNKSKYVTGSIAQLNIDVIAKMRL